MRGRFITFEGGEGSGKSTQIRHLAEWLRQQGIVVSVTREPGGSPMGERIRALLLDPSAKLDALTQLFLFCAARRDHVVASIAPALQRGEWVLCDRFIDSTRAYQGAANAIPLDLISRLETAAIGATRPDLTIILDIAPERGLERANMRRGKDSADAFEAADIAFHQRVREAYLAQALAEPERCKVIAAEGSEQIVAKAVIDLCRKHFELLEKGIANA